jgi:sporulation protein YlmC with PRC-barrel domain
MESSDDYWFKTDKKMKYSDLLNKNVYDKIGVKIGKIENLYVDTETKTPTWLHIETEGDKYTFVPIESATYDDEADKVITSYQVDFVKGAPQFDEGQIVSDADERALYEYYSLAYNPYQIDGVNVLRLYVYAKGDDTNLDY